MSSRVEVNNPPVNTNNLRLLRVKLEDRNGLRTIVESEEFNHAIPGQRIAANVAAGAGYALLIEEMPPHAARDEAGT